METAAWRAWAGQLSTGLAWLDGDVRVAWLNAALAERLGVGTRGVVGQPLSSLWRESAGVDAVQRVCASGESLQLRDIRLVTADGGELRADVAMQPLDGGVLLEVHALSAADARDSPLSATLRGFAHEMKNPLSGMRGAAQLLQRRVDDGQSRALADLIVAEVDRLTALADRLLHHDGAPALAPVNIHAVLRRALDLLQLAPTHPVIRLDYDPSVPEISADADRLQQVLLNVLRNAVEAGAGKLTLCTRVEHGVRVGKRMLTSALRVDVCDDGPGIDPALVDTLFEPLVSGRTDGVGLGLALSRELAREHGGELRCTSRSGATVFSLYLPLDASHA